MNKQTESMPFDAIELTVVEMMDADAETVTLDILEQSVIKRLEKEVGAEVIDVTVLESLTKTLDTVAHHLKRRDDDLFRASSM